MTTRVCRPKTTPSYPPVPISRFVNVNTSVGVRTHANAVKVTGGTQAAKTRIGVTWTSVRPSSSMASVISVHDAQMQHTTGFGVAPGPFDSAGNYPSSPNWGSFDACFQEVRNAGAIQKMMSLHQAPTFMRRGNQNNVDQSPVDSYFDEFANTQAQCVARLTDFQWAVVWNEYKDFWNNTLNRPDWERFTIFYNQVYNAVKAVRPTLKVGGPYSTMISSQTGSGSHPSSVVTFPGGSMDQRWLDTFSHFVANCPYDFLAWDGGTEHFAPGLGGQYFGDHYLGHPGRTPQEHAQKWVNMISWMRGLSAKANTVPIICFECYLHMPGIAPAGPSYPPGTIRKINGVDVDIGIPGHNYGGGWGWTATQVEDFYFEVMEQVNAVSPNGPLYFLNWFHPLFWPQVINKQSDYVWLNTESTWRSKVASYHATGAYP